MNYLLPINALFDRFWLETLAGYTLFDTMHHQITDRGCPNPVCSQLRHIHDLDRACKLCDSAALNSTADYEYDCPWGFKESVFHLPLSVGTAHVIIGKYRRKGDEAAKNRLRAAILKNGLNESLLDEYTKIPTLTERESAALLRSLKEELKKLAAGNYLQSLGNETVLQMIEIFKVGMDDHKKFAIARYCRDQYSELGYTRHALDDLFWDLCEERFSDFLRERRLVCAEHWLTNSTRPIKTIAHRLGYNEAYFSDFFKKFCNVSPRMFRDHAFLGTPHSLHVPF